LFIIEAASRGGYYKRPDLQTVIARMETFKKWPRDTGQRPEELSEAGLYYTGNFTASKFNSPCTAVYSLSVDYSSI